MSLPPSRCFERRCKHYLGVVWLGEDESSEEVHCEAFLQGIPDEIAYGDNLHIEPYPGDGGIRYEKEDEV